jgi:hypothetical protein
VDAPALVQLQPEPAAPLLPALSGRTIVLLVTTEVIAPVRRFAG